MAILQQGLTLEEFLMLPEEKPALEFWEGLVTQKVSPKTHHSRLQGKLVELINQFAEPRKLALAFPEIRATYDGSSLVPDVAVYRWERIPREPNGRPVNDLFLPPDIAIEIASPKQTLEDLANKCRWYVQHGVAIAIMVDPQDDNVIRYAPNVDQRVLGGDERIDLDAVLPGFQLTVKELFDTLVLD